MHVYMSSCHSMSDSFCYLNRFSVTCVIVDKKSGWSVWQKVDLRTVYCKANKQVTLPFSYSLSSSSSSFSLSRLPLTPFPLSIWFLFLFLSSCFSSSSSDSSLLSFLLLFPLPLFPLPIQSHSNSACNLSEPIPILSIVICFS